MSAVDTHARRTLRCAATTAAALTHSITSFIRYLYNVTYGPFWMLAGAILVLFFLQLGPFWFQWAVFDIHWGRFGDGLFWSLPVQYSRGQDSRAVYSMCTTPGGGWRAESLSIYPLRLIIQLSLLRWTNRQSPQLEPFRHVSPTDFLVKVCVVRTLQHGRFIQLHTHHGGLIELHGIVGFNVPLDTI